MNPKLPLLIFIIIAALYGTSYQQFRHFNIEEPSGSSDARYYIALSHGDYDVPLRYRHRLVVPLCASFVRTLIANFVDDKEELDKLSFYIVNFSFIAATSVIFSLILGVMGFSMEMSLLGVLIFLSSRVVVYSAGTPMVDSVYFLAISVIVYLTLQGNGKLLVLLLPLLALSKETIYPFLFLPLCNRDMRKTPLIVSLVFSFAVLWGVRTYTDYLIGAAPVRSGYDMAFVITSHLNDVGTNLASLFTLRGIHNLQHGFSFVVILALFGYFLNSRERIATIQRYLLLILPLSLVYAVLSSNSGRMFFSSWVIVIPYALISIQYWFVARGAGKPDSSTCSRSEEESG